MTQLPPPTAFGAPDKFGEWRPNQEQAVLQMVGGEYRFLMQVQPTGSGKSLCYVMAAILSGERALILTSTKALQDQIMADFGNSFPIVDVRGQAGYVCLHNTEVNCDNGLCHVGYECELKGKGCLYYDAVRRARNTQIVVTNYAFWMAAAKAEDPIGKFDLLVLDEAHDAPEWVMKAMSATISKQIEGDTGKRMVEGEEPGEWRDWAGMMIGVVQDKRKEVEKVIATTRERGSISKGMRLKQYERALVNVTGNSPANMVIDKESVPDHVVIEPISAVGLAEKLLFRGIGKVVLTSATVRPKTLHMMGIGNTANIQGNGELVIEEYPSPFDSSRRPVIWVPTVRVQFGMTVGDIRRWIAQIDNVIRQRQDRKGVIHSVSYARAREIMGGSEFRDIMIIHDKRSLAYSITTFKKRNPPAILISPSVSTGYDFPYDQCEYQIISKVPFPDTRSPSIKARTKHDPEYSYYITMQQIVQASGRGMRSEDDQCEVFIVDDNWQWFSYKWRKFAPKWFTESYVMGRTIPRPPAKMMGR